MKVLLTTESHESIKESEIYETLEQCVDELLALYKTKLTILRIPDYYPEWLKDHKYIIKVDDRITIEDRCEMERYKVNITEDMRQRIIEAARKAIDRSHEDDDCIDRTEVETQVLCGLLKMIDERKAIKPTINEYGEAYCICGENVGIISSSKNLPSIRSKYCSECGRRMKWE